MDRVKMQRVVRGLRYDTEKATLLADDVFWDGHNHERHGRNLWLYRGSGGSYFTVSGTWWQGERNALSPVSESEAMRAFEELPERAVTFEEAFPGVKIEAA